AGQDVQRQGDDDSARGDAPARGGRNADAAWVLFDRADGVAQGDVGVTVGADGFDQGAAAVLELEPHQGVAEARIVVAGQGPDAQGVRIRNLVQGAVPEGAV